MMPDTESPFEEVEGSQRPVRGRPVSDNGRSQDRQEEELSPLTRPPIDWRRARKITWITFIIILGAMLCTGLLLYGIWYATRPPGYRLIALITTHDRCDALIPCRNGFLFQEQEDFFALHDWEHGKINWQVTLQPPAVSAVSHSGRFFASISDDGHLRVWDNGSLISTSDLKQTFPIYSQKPMRGKDGRIIQRPYRIFKYSNRVNMQVLDDGRVFMWPLQQVELLRDTPLTLLQNGRVIAKQYGRNIGHDEQFIISPDGNSVCTLHYSSQSRELEFHYAALEMKDGRISLSDQSQTAQQNGILPWFWELYSSDGSVAPTGAIYRSTDWKYLNPDSFNFTFTRFIYDCTGVSGFCYAVPLQGELDIKNKIPIPSPLTENWAVQLPGLSSYEVSFTPDGRYALIYRGPQQESFPWSLRGKCFFLANGSNGRGTLMLYERPGRLRAVLRGVNYQEFDRLYSWQFYPSPDGHALVTLLPNKSHLGNTCLLYRW